MESKSIVMSVVMDGREGSKNPAREYAASDGDTYIEGREGTAFVIRVQNRSGRRVAVIPSVDGLSVMDGTKASDASGGYVLDAHATLDIPGWKRGPDKVASFEFAGMKDGKDSSYVAQIGGDVEHKGVIGLTVFEERRRPREHMKGGGGVFRGMAHGASAQNAMPFSLSASSASSPMWSSPEHENTSLSDDAPEQTLGTGYGAEADFRTVTSDFRRGEFLTRMALFYDDERGLKRRGIDVKRPLRAKPNPFPGNQTCPPPPGWTPR